MSSTFPIPLPTKPIVTRILLLGILLCLLALAPGQGTRTSLAASAHNTATTDLVDASTERSFDSYIVLLEEEPVAAFYVSLLEGEQASAAAIQAMTQAHLANIEQAQLQLADTLANHEAQILYRVQRVLNGIAIYAPTDEVAAIAALPGVQGVYPLIPKEPTNVRTDTLLNAPGIWEGLNMAGLTGKGITIAIIDTGIDYLHSMFGGPGTGHAENDTSIIGDAPNFPGPKIIGGFDFTGDKYDASPTSVNFQPIPQPDPDPMDCWNFGHGTHVAGTAAGYGVRANGTTYEGPYDSSIPLDSLRIAPGLAPEASIYALKVFGCTGSSNVVDAAIEWAVDPNQDGDFSDRVDVINLSLGSSLGSRFDATTLAVENAAKLGIIVVTSAGNNGDVHYVIGSPGVASGAITVAATSIDTTNPNALGDGMMASFSSRGPRRGDHALKPDLAAPGVNIISSRRGAGSQATSSSGTSMASPVVAGIMALLRQAYPESGFPGWKNHELKALVMNTAVYPILRPDINGPYSMLRVGSGRIDPQRALQSRLIAYDAEAPDRVSVSFGEIAVLDQTTAVRSIRLANKSTEPISVTVGYTTVSPLPGVTIHVETDKIITIPAMGFATTSVTLTANAAQMNRRVDPARQLIPIDDHPWIDEASGYISFTPVITSNGPSIHLPVHAVPRVISALSAWSAPIDLADNDSATFPITITGSAVTSAVAPTQTVPLFGVFGLAHSSPPVSELPNGEPLLGRFAQADLQYIGIAGPVLVDDEPVIYFALVSYGSWATPLEVIYTIAIDVNNDNIADFRLQNREATDISAVDFSTTDEFVSILERRGGVRKIQGPLNLYEPTKYDARPFGNNVMILPLRLNDLGNNVRNFRYQVTSTSRDLVDLSLTIEQTPILSLRLGDGAAITTNLSAPLVPVTPGETFQVTIDRAAYVRQQLQGLLLIHLHNDFGMRSQVLPVAHDWYYHQYLPGIHGN